MYQLTRAVFRIPTKGNQKENVVGKLSFSGRSRQILCCRSPCNHGRDTNNSIRSYKAHTH